MSTIYIPVTTKKEAEAVITKMYELISPPAQRQEDWQPVTLGSAEKLGEQWFLVLPDDYEVNIHPQADENVIDEILTPFVNKGMAKALERSNTKSAVRVIIEHGNEEKVINEEGVEEGFRRNGNRRVRAFGLLEGLEHVQKNAKTREQLVELGLISEDI